MSAPTTIRRVDVLDIRFPSSEGKHGSDAMHVDPDYSAAYVILRTDRTDAIEGHGLTFTLRRGTELCVGGIRALAPLSCARRFDRPNAEHSAVGDRTYWTVMLPDMAAPCTVQWYGYVPVALNVL